MDEYTGTGRRNDAGTDGKISSDHSDIVNYIVNLIFKLEFNLIYMFWR